MSDTVNKSSEKSRSKSLKRLRMSRKNTSKQVDKGPEIYDMIDERGSQGQLIELAKRALFDKRFDQIDDYLLENVPRYLYHKGKGKQIPLDELLKCRINRKGEGNEVGGEILIEKEDQSQDLAVVVNATPNPEAPTGEPSTRFVCWRVDKRGNSGENLLHLCLLHGSIIHTIIAQRMLMYFPKLVNDIYLNDSMYGQSALHMAIVNEDVRMVKHLISMGSDIHQRCIGRFFMPDDQKAKLASSSEWYSKEYPNMPLNTDYQGLSYFGEYPLTFAAILNLEECVRILVAKHADPNRQDLNGNTVLHMLVIKDNLDMFKLLIELRARLDIKNLQGFTPLTLAAELGRKEIFFYILERTRDVYWTYSDITCAGYPLDSLDTLNDDGSTNSKSSLYLILNKNTEEHLEMLEGVLFDLLHQKWNSYLKYHFYIEVSIFALFFFLSGLTIFFKRFYYDWLQANNYTDRNYDYTLLPNHTCAYLYPLDDAKVGRTFLEVVIILYACFYIGTFIRAFKIQGWHLFIETILANPTRIMFLFSLACIVLIIPFRIACNTYAEDILVAFAIISLAIYSLYYARGFRRVCTFVYNIHQIVRNNISVIVLIYAIFLIGFSQMFYLILLYCNDYLPREGAPPFSSPLQAILETFVLTLIEVTVDFENMPFVSSYSILGEIFFTVYLVVGGVLLINLLIAMMDHTQEKTNELPNEWIRQWGLQVIATEQNVSQKERVKQQSRYTRFNNLEQRIFIVRWRQNKAERDETVLENKRIFGRKIREANLDDYRKNESNV